MRLGRLRNQMLIAMGIPACWTSTSTAPQPPPPPVVKASLQFDSSTCPRDTIPESVCGERRETARACGAHATNLTSVEESKLYLTEEDADNPAVAYREFQFDRDETRRYRENLDDESTRASSCCYSQCTPMVVGRADPIMLQAGYMSDQKCLPAPPNGTSKPVKEDPACAEGVSLDGTLRPYVSTEEGQCCYSVPMRSIQIHSIPGRALRIDGQLHVADVVRARRGDANEAGSGWTAKIAPSLALEPTVRTRLATAWLEIAQLEHASVAAFAALALRLIAAGAPPALIAGAHEAALDEVRHAQIAFGLASAYGGERVGPGRFDAARLAPTSGDLHTLAIETFVDGCINETAAAHEAEIAAATASDPEVAAALAEIAEDEARHGALAWAVVAWCVRQRAITVAELRELAASAVRSAMLLALETARDLPSAMPAAHDLPSAMPAAHDHARALLALSATDESSGDLAGYGVLGAAASAKVRCDVLREVVEPCIAALAA